jgi:hypothetical protein
VTSSRPSSRPGSSANSRRSTAEQQPVLKRQSSHSLAPASCAVIVDGASDTAQGAPPAAAAPVALPRASSGVGAQRQLSKSGSSRAASADTAGERRLCPHICLQHVIVY